MVPADATAKLIHAQEKKEEPRLNLVRTRPCCLWSKANKEESFEALHRTVSVCQLVLACQYNMVLIWQKLKNFLHC
jgi:hypothetical protein